MRIHNGLVAMMLALGLTGVQADEAAVRKGLAALLPDLKPESVKPGPVAGLHEVVIGPQVFYVSNDGRYLIQGRIVDMQTRQDLTEARQAEAKKAAMADVSEDQMVIFAPKDYKHTITVFTDIDCGYCRKLHGEMEQFNAEGIRVRYLFFPRAGVGSPSYEKAVSVWCAADRNKAMTDAKTGKPVETKTCDNPVKDHLELGELMGVTGTPAIVLQSGQMLPGYIPAKRMAAFLNGQQQ